MRNKLLEAWVTVATAVFSAVGGGWLTQLAKNRGDVNTRHADELAKFRVDLMQELKLAKEEAKSDVEKAEQKAAESLKIVRDEAKTHTDQLRRELNEAKLEAKRANDRADNLEARELKNRYAFAAFRQKFKVMVMLLENDDAKWKRLRDDLMREDPEVDSLLEPSSDLSKPHEIPAIAMMSEPRILIVDDDADALLMLTKALQDEPYRCDVAGDASAAIEKLESSRIEGKPIGLVLLDYSMPMMNGVGLAHLIRNRFAHIKLIFLTAHPDGVTREDIERVGALCRMEKPVDLERLKQTIAEALAS